MKNSQTRILLQTLLLNDPAIGSEKYEAMMETYDGKRASVRCPVLFVRNGSHYRLPKGNRLPKGATGRTTFFPNWQRSPEVSP